MNYHNKFGRKRSLLAWALASKIGPGFRMGPCGPLTYRTRNEARSVAALMTRHKVVRVRLTIEELAA